MKLRSFELVPEHSRPVGRRVLSGQPAQPCFYGERTNGRVEMQQAARSQFVPCHGAASMQCTFRGRQLIQRVIHLFHRRDAGHTTSSWLEQPHVGGHAASSFLCPLHQSPDVHVDRFALLAKSTYGQPRRVAVDERDHGIHACFSNGTNRIGIASRFSEPMRSPSMSVSLRRPIDLVDNDRERFDTRANYNG